VDGTTEEMGSTMKPISPTDALFLVGESREHPMHVGL